MRHDAKVLFHQTYLDKQKIVEKALADLETARVNLREEAGNLLIQCECGKVQHVKELDVRKTYGYESPSGCMGGDRWHYQDTRVSCESCGTNLVFTKKQKDLMLPFKSSEKTYDW